MKIIDWITAIFGILTAILVGVGVVYFAFRKKKPKEQLPKQEGD